MPRNTNLKPTDKERYRSRAQNQPSVVEVRSDGSPRGLYGAPASPRHAGDEGSALRGVIAPLSAG